VNTKLAQVNISCQRYPTKFIGFRLFLINLEDFVNKIKTVLLLNGLVDSEILRQNAHANIAFQFAYPSQSAPSLEELILVLGESRECQPLAACRTNNFQIHKPMQSFEIKCKTNEVPLSSSSKRTSQRELTKSHRFFDDTDNRFNSTLA